VARVFLARRAAAFGIRPQARDLRVSSVLMLAARRAVVRLQQFRDGVPVLGGELVVNLDRDRNVLSAGGETMRAGPIQVEPTVGPAAARAAAIRVTARAHGIAAGNLRASRPQLWIYDPEILGRIGQPSLVWRIDVSGDGRRGPVDELVLVDARIGLVALHFDQVETAMYRRVCDGHNTSTQGPCRRPVRREGGWPSTVRDVNAAYTFTGDTYDFYRGRFGRDSLDDAGMTITSTVRYCDPRVQHCRRMGWKNAAWDPELQQVVFGRGYAAADDVVGHELTHGVIDHTSRLFYYYQSGAINESLADVFGEFVDLTNGRGTDTRAVRWRLGEDLPGGAVRDMRNPRRYGQPDRMTSMSYEMDRHEEDDGGVHTNSGVGNKAAFLITAGGTFRGRTVRGLGIVKAASIYYEVMTNLLTSGSDYADLALALPQACTNLVGSEGITSADCEQVTAAVSAVDMAAEPNGTSHAPVCPVGERSRDLFLDDLENPASGNWAAQASGGNDWHYPSARTPHGDATYATSGAMNFFAYDSANVGDASIVMTHSVQIPAGGAAYLHFNHAYDFAEGGMSTYDGGVVEYSTDEGQTWQDAGPLLLEHGYNGTIVSGFENPLAGHKAFVRQSYGYISSRADLGPLAGRSVRFGFRIGTGAPEWVRPDHGWFVDDIRIYSCVR
jgi:Zn-dependent metalloprotease